MNCETNNQNTLWLVAHYSVAAEWGWQDLAMMLPAGPAHPNARGFTVSVLLCRGCHQAVCFYSYSLAFFPLNMSAAVPNKTEGTMTLKCLLKPKYSCGERSGRSGTGSSRLSFRVVIFIAYLWLPWRLVLACGNSQSSKTLCRTALVQSHSSHAVFVFTQHGNYLRSAQSPS